MRKYLIYIIVAVACLSCGREVEEPGAPSEQERVTITAAVRPSLMKGKSSVDCIDEWCVNYLQVFAYRDGILDVADYSTEGAELDLIPGEEYKIYALANCYEVRPPANERDLKTLRITQDGPWDMEEGLPMSCGPVCYYPSNENSRLYLPMERLVSRWDFQLNFAFEQSSFQVYSAILYQAPSDVTPFQAGSIATEVIEGDYASPDDLDALNSGEMISLYVLENCHGELLPGNTDPWEKNPWNIDPQEADTCTFLELEGMWTTPGASATVLYRIYLGQDNCTDFSIVRNTINTVELTLTDEGALLNNWKAETIGLTDSRNICFEDDTVTVYQGNGLFATTIFSSPDNAAYVLEPDEEEFEDARLSWELTEDGELLLRSAFIGAQRKLAHMHLRSWDGRITDDLVVKIDYVPTDFTDYTFQERLYCGQWGCFDFPTASNADPVIFSVGGRTIEVGKSLSTKGVDFTVSSLGVKFYYISGTDKVYYQNLTYSGAGSAEITLSQGMKARSFMMYEAVMPNYAHSPLVLNEDGTTVQMPVWLEGKDGSMLSLETFAMPQPMLSYMGYAQTENNRYADFCDWFTNELELSVSSSYGSLYVASIMEDPSLVEDGYVALMNVWGLRASGGNALMLPISLSNSYFPEGHMRKTSTCTIQPAFPMQTYLGEVQNCQLAPGALRSNEALVQFATSFKPTGHATWEIRNTNFTESDTPSQSWDRSIASYYASGVSFDGRKMVFSSLSRYSWPCSGGFTLKGTVTNLHSGRVITGYYNVDVVLNLAVGAQVRFINTGSSKGCMAWNFAPFCEFSTTEYSDIWNDCFPHFISVRSGYPRNSTSVIHVAEDDEDYQILEEGQYPIPPYSQALAESSLQGLQNTHFSFDFLLDGITSSSLELTRSGFRNYPSYSSLSNGSSGFYRIRRQFDIGNLGQNNSSLENYVIEAAYNQF